jgi:hypothetical protein
MTRMTLDFAVRQISTNDPTSPAIYDNQVQHLSTWQQLNLATAHLPHQSTVGTQKQLLTGLSPGIKGSRNLSAAKGTISQITSILPGKGNTLGNTLVDDIVADLSQAINIRFAGSKIPSLNGIEKEPPDTVVVIGVILGRVNAALSRDAMSSSSGIMNAEGLHIVTQLCKAGGC